MPRVDGLVAGLVLLAVPATDVLAASCGLATICSLLNRLFLMRTSLSKSDLLRNYWHEEDGQVSIALTPQGSGSSYCGKKLDAKQVVN